MTGELKYLNYIIIVRQYVSPFYPLTSYAQPKAYGGNYLFFLDYPWVNPCTFYQYLISYSDAKSWLFTSHLSDEKSN